MKQVVMGIALSMPIMLNSMQVQMSKAAFTKLLKENAEEAWLDAAANYFSSPDCAMPYAFYKPKMNEALPYVTEKQRYIHNPLIEPILHDDYKCTKHFLKLGLSPVYKDFRKFDAFDALRFKGYSSKQGFEKYKKFLDLLLKYCKKDEKHIPYRNAAFDKMYMDDFNFLCFIDEDVYRKDEQFREFIKSDVSARMITIFEDNLKIHKKI